MALNGGHGGSLGSALSRILTRGMACSVSNFGALFTWVGKHVGRYV